MDFVGDRIDCLFDSGFEADAGSNPAPALAARMSLLKKRFPSAADDLLRQLAVAYCAVPAAAPIER